MAKLILCLAVFLLALNPASLPARDGDKTNPFPSARITSEGMVLAYPDVALFNFTILTEAPRAASAAAENSQKAEAFLHQVKKFLPADDSIKTVGYRLMPVFSYGDKGKKPTLAGYRAASSFQVRTKDLARLGELVDLAVQQGVNEVQGPLWQHSGLDTLTQEAGVQALQKARTMAEALAKSQGLKVKRLHQFVTLARIGPAPRDEVRLMRAAAAPESAATPIEVGEQEIRAQIEAVFELE